MPLASEKVFCKGRENGGGKGGWGVSIYVTFFLRNVSLREYGNKNRNTIVMKRNIVFFVCLFLLSGALSKAFCSEGGGRGDIEEAIASIVGDYVGLVGVADFVVNCENSELKKVLTSRDSLVLSEFFNGVTKFEIINSGDNEVELLLNGFSFKSSFIMNASNGVYVNFQVRTLLSFVGDYGEIYTFRMYNTSHFRDDLGNSYSMVFSREEKVLKFFLRGRLSMNAQGTEGSKYFYLAVFAKKQGR